MDVTYIAAAPALARLHQEHHDHPDRMKHRIDAANSRRERSYVRRLFRRTTTRRTFEDLALVDAVQPQTRHLGSFG
jgi:hypothetical protein